MKMNKILAAGVAATLAVTSLASVASAEEITFDMGQTKGTIKLAATVGQEVAFLADANGQAPATLTIGADGYAVINTATATKNIKNVKIAVTGIKGTKSSSSKTYTYALTNYGDANADGDAFDWRNQKYDGSGKNWVFRAYKDTAPADSFVPSQFVEITKLELILEAEKTVTTAAEYDAWGSSTWGENVDNLVVTPFAGAQAGDILDAINKVAFTNNYAYMSFSEKSTTVDYPFMAVTDNGDKTLTRQEIGLLSYADAHSAVNGGNNGGVDGDQTYDDNGFGTNPNDFAGLASQVGDFFNKQTNGTITFKFTAATASTGTAWQNGGVPSTQVGIKNALGAATANDFALFFNYNQTGSLQAVTAIDANAGTVTFDIADVLDALDGKTIGVIDNIYYGMTKGVTYADLGKTGLKVETITLAYDEDAADDADIEDDTDADDDTDVEDDDDDAVIEDDDDDDDDATVEDDDDDDADVEGDVDPVTPADDDDDANPGTGVALAVVPALVAAAAVVVSKKRK